MNYSIEEIIKQIKEDIEYDDKMVKSYPENSKEWNFHLGRLDALTSVKWKLEERLNSNFK